MEAARRQSLSDLTDLIAAHDASSINFRRLLHRIRTTAFRIRADCERILEELQTHEHDAWRQGLVDAFVASRELVALTSHSLVDASPGNAPGAAARQLVERLDGPRRRLLDSTSRILRLVPTTPEEELLIADARAVRDAALTLLQVGGDDVQPQAQSAAARVLVVEDDAVLRELLRRQLASLGHEALLAKNGILGLQLAERDQPDLILTDIAMPEMDGIEFLRLIKKNERTRDIPVVVVSGSDDIESVVRCIELGAVDHISKPFQTPLLDARIRSSLEWKRGRDAELGYLKRVQQLTAAAEAVENESYVTGSLQEIASENDALGVLARVFDRVVAGLKSREARLQRRLLQLRDDVGGTTGRRAVAAQLSSESPFASGEILAARYEILGHLGKGGMGTVYHARDRELGDEVAIKVVRKDLIKEDPTITERLKSEIRLARRISHRNVVRVHDLGEWHGSYFITMELVHGVTVETLLDRRGLLSVESGLAIGSQLAEALAVAHEQQIVHRDIKPANLLIDDAGVLKVMDFGIARSIEPDAKPITASGFVIGTPEYMPPEQLRGGNVDARADLFALGVVLYECLAGTLPFAGRSLIELISRIESGTFVGLRERRADVPERLEAIVHQQLRGRPGDRSASAREVSEQLAEVNR